MQTDLLVPTPPRVTVGYERKLSQPLPTYEHEIASIYVQADLDAENPEQSIKDAFFQARAAVFEQLGVKSDYVEGVLREILPEPKPQASQPPPSNNTPTSVGTGDGPPSCPKCGGQTWDKRKSNAEAVAGGNASASKRPDFKCKNKEGCGEGVWLKAKGR